MAASWASSSRIAAVGIIAAAALSVATAPMASAQLPGVGKTLVFPIDDTRVTIVVGTPDVAAGTVAVKVQNNTAGQLNCTGINGGQAGAVTTAELAAKSVDYYSKYPTADISPIDVDINVPSIISGSVGALGDGFPIDIGSAVGKIPGGIAGLLDPEWGARAEIGSEFAQARLDGHYGGMGANVSFPASSTKDLNVVLGQTSRGERQQFQAGVVMTCVVGGQRYIFNAYEGERAPAVDQGTGSLVTDTLSSGNGVGGSLGSGN